MRFLSLEVALDRVEAIWVYEQDPRRRGRGARFDAQLQATLRRIDETPHGFPREARIKRPIVRRAKVLRFPYAVIYYVHRGEPIIVAIEAQKRAPLYWAKRLRA